MIQESNSSQILQTPRPFTSREPGATGGEKCQFCGGIVKKKTVSFDLWKKEKLYVFKSVPAKVCEQCGEKYFSPKIYGLIDKLLKEKSKPDETMVVPVMSLKKFADEAEAFG